MDATDRQLITDLADRVRAAATGGRDPEAAALIDSSFGDPRAAVYVLTQAVLVQEQALAAAQARVDELEAQQAPPAADRGGFMSNLFGRRTEHPQPNPQQPGGTQQPAQQAWANHPGAAQPAAPAGGGGSFMKTAAGVAAGVAGGALLATGVSAMFSEPPTTQENSAAPAEQGPTEDDDWGW
ncbi:DUF2076 family protein [Pseudonocardia sp. ICBG162]|uniref:DUF2076 domain-containing protein n=1 Tax=Pseudonocardia sp. ICBG162 TaxID=2846761 RepID=UPI001CF6CCF9|nr:DUF2076 family protein [Pseudonocardia sp. ICBG162]